MKRRICKIGTGEVISVGIIILLVFRFVSVYLNQEEKLHSELFMLFTEVVQEEKEQQIGKQKDIMILKILRMISLEKRNILGVFKIILLSTIRVGICWIASFGIYYKKSI